MRAPTRHPRVGERPTERVLFPIGAPSLTIGIRYKLENVGTDFNTILQRELKRDYSAAATLFLSGAYPDAQLNQYHYTGASRNYADFSDPKLDAMMDAQSREFDFNKRKQIVQDIQRELIQNPPGFIWIGSRTEAVAFAALIGIPAGVLSAVRQDSPADYLARGGAVLFLAVPGFYLATLLQSLFSIRWGINIASIHYTPLTQHPLANLQQMWLPALILSLGTAAQVMRMTRAMMLEVLRQDYIRTATAKGLHRGVVLTRHALRNALMPVVTIFGLTMAFLIGGTVIFESIFSLPGMGRYLIEAVTRRDYAAVQGVTLVFAVSVVVINLLVDLSYTWLDPRHCL
jgi:ABC-type dipeptide/oligopeptide/nickel transport system permease component